MLEELLKKVEISNLPDNELKVLVTKVGRGVDELRKDFREGIEM